MEMGEAAMRKRITRKRLFVIIHVLILFSVLLYVSYRWFLYETSREATISGDVTVCIDGADIDSSAVLLECVQEDNQRVYAVARKDEEKKCGYSVVTYDKGYFGIELAIPSHLMEQRIWEENYVKYNNIFIFNIMGGRVESDIHIDIWKENKVYKSRCIVTTKVGKDASEDVCIEERIINEKPSKEIRSGL